MGDHQKTSVGNLNRREFLRLGGIALGSIFASPWINSTTEWSVDDLRSPELIARVTTREINIYSEPNFKSQRVGRAERDQLLWVLNRVHQPSSWQRNPRWYQLVDGYVHSAYTQVVENRADNTPLSTLSDERQLGEITVPYAQSYRRDRRGRYDPLYRLYYQSVHWITRIEQGLGEQPIYGIWDERLRIVHYVPASYVRPINQAEIVPISPDVPAEEKRIAVLLNDQKLRAFEGGQLVYETEISSGMTSRGPSSNGIPTNTPEGHFRIQVKMPSRHMGDGRLTSYLHAYELPGVPWVSFFHNAGIALHGTYWHDNFGHRMSHGCVNMRNGDAKWIYRWSMPTALHNEWRCLGSGTRIRVVE